MPIGTQYKLSKYNSPALTKESMPTVLENMQGSLEQVEA